MTDTTQDDALHLTRTIPTPSSLSPEARAAISMGAALVPDRLANPQVYPALDDNAAWKARIAVMDEAILTGFAARGDTVDADVEKIDVDGIDVYVIIPAGADTADDAPLLYDIHGGALIAGGGEACKMMGTNAAVRCRLATWSVDYRMPPDHPYPTPLDDCVTVYRALLDIKPAEKIAVAGGSAGGNLAAALMLRARAEGLPMPKALLLFTPEADLTESGDSFDTNEGVDHVLVSRLTESIALYAQGHDLSDPYLSPLFGDLSGFPPTFLQTGTRDLFLSNTVRMHRALRDAGVDAELHVWEAMPHGGFFGAPEDDEIGVEVRRFLEKHL
jgi:monoterpene epsilon-lactone hydrolase